MANREPIGWITVKGKRVPLFEGESKEESIKNALGDKAKQIDQNKKEADRKNAQEKQNQKSDWKVTYDRDKAKAYKSKNVIAAKKSAEDMGGFGRNALQIQHQSSSAIDDTYKLIHKESGLQVGAVVERRVGGATLYMYKATRKK